MQAPHDWGKRVKGVDVMCVDKISGERGTPGGGRQAHLEQPPHRLCARRLDARKLASDARAHVYTPRVDARRRALLPLLLARLQRLAQQLQALFLHPAHLHDRRTASRGGRVVVGGGR
eukprot:357397-Chlamydomonas_euryale.AAC.11